MKLGEGKRDREREGRAYRNRRELLNGASNE